VTGVDLVSGGAGFIGSHLCAALRAAGRRVRVLDDLSTGQRENLAGLDVEFLEGDAADPALAREACRGTERIFHLAARSSVPWSVAHPEAARRANLESTLTLLEAAAAAGVRRLVFSSSSAVYGDGGGEDRARVESDPPAPASPYAEHKLAGEEALAAAAAAGRLEAVCLRYFNVYGPRQDPSSPYSGVISLFTRLALEGRPATIHGDGLQTRDFVYVADVVRANLLAGERPLAVPTPICNVGRGESVTILELWRRVCAAAGAPCPAPVHAPPRAGDVRHSRAAIERARALLGFQATVALEQGLQATVAWERQRQEA